MKKTCSPLVLYSVPIPTLTTRHHLTQLILYEEDLLPPGVEYSVPILTLTTRHRLAQLNLAEGETGSSINQNLEPL